MQLVKHMQQLTLKSINTLLSKNYGFNLYAFGTATKRANQHNTDCSDVIKF